MDASPREPPEPESALDRLLRHLRAQRSWPLLIIAIIALAFFLQTTRSFVLPVLVALLLKVALSPVVRLMRQVGLPAAAGAGLVIIALVAVVTATIYGLSAPAGRWLDELPRVTARIRESLPDMPSPVRNIKEASRTVSDMTEEEPAQRPLKVQVVEGGALETLWERASTLVINSFLAIILLYFMLAADDAFLRKVVSVLPRLEDKKVAVEITRGIESQISRYLLTITCINAVLGAAVGTLAWLLRLPNPVLWGMMAALLNYVPYLGPLVGAVLLGVVAVATHGATWEALLAPAGYVVLNYFEGLLITPAILGARFSLSPAVIFVWLMIASWLWGIPGAFIATPFLVAINILCVNVPPLRPVATFLGP